MNALVCFQVSLKSLQVYDEYGVSKDPLQLQGQVRELKVQLENQTKLILQMQSPLRRNSLSGELVANAADPSTVKDQEGTQRRDHTRDGGYGSGQLGEKKEGENQADKRSSLNLDLERESTVNRSMSEQLQQTRSHSTSPARSTVSLNA